MSSSNRVKIFSRAQKRRAEKKRQHTQLAQEEAKATKRDPDVTDDATAPVKKIDEVCNNYLAGKCRNGENCRRIHQGDEKMTLLWYLLVPQSILAQAILNSIISLRGDERYGQCPALLLLLHDVPLVLVSPFCVIFHLLCL